MDSISSSSFRAAGIVILAVAFLFPACAGRKSDNANELHLLLNRHPFTESIMRFFPEFEGQTGLKINTFLLSEEEYNEKLITELSSRSGRYDVFMCGFAHIWQYAPAGWMEPLDAYVKDPELTPPEWDFDDFFPNLIHNSRWEPKPGGKTGEGPLWAIPVNQEGYVIFYRRDLFDRFNVKIPESFAELRQAAAALTRTVDGQQIYGFVNRGIPSWTTINTGYITAFYSAGAVDFDSHFRCVINSPAGIALTDLFVGTLRDYGPPGWPGYTWYEVKEGFLSGKFAMAFDANHQAMAYENAEKSPIAGNVGYLLPPPGTDGKRGSNTWIWSLGMNALSDNKANAWRFIRWATSRDILQRTLPYENINPVRRSVWNDPKTVELTGWADGEYRRTAELFLDGAARIYWTPNPQIARVGDRWAVALQEIFSRTRSAAKALSDAAADIDGMMENSGWWQQGTNR